MKSSYQISSRLSLMTLEIVFLLKERAREKSTSKILRRALFFSLSLKLETPNGYKWFVHSACLLKKTTQCAIYRQRIKQSVYANRMIIRVYTGNVFFSAPFFSVQFNKFQLLCSHAARSLINRPTKCTAPILNAMHILYIYIGVSVYNSTDFCFLFSIFKMN